jgi:hypothetical protein
MEKLDSFTNLLVFQQLQQLATDHMVCEANVNNKQVHCHLGKKYTRVDIGASGRFMVDNSNGAIYGIKGYGQVNKAKPYGTLDTINEYFWGNYYPQKKV